MGSLADDIIEAEVAEIDRTIFLLFEIAEK